MHLLPSFSEVCKGIHTSNIVRSKFYQDKIAIALRQDLGEEDELQRKKGKRLKIIGRAVKVSLERMTASHSMPAPQCSFARGHERTPHEQMHRI